MADESTTPKFLYKVISLRNWQISQGCQFIALSSDDDQFIHLATEDQLPNVVIKYWRTAPQYVILKLDSSQLIGRMRYEANPGKTTLYYHLYEGSIPFKSLVESKICYCETPSYCKEGKREVVLVGDPLLRQKARALSKEEILSDTIQSLIQNMRAVLAEVPGVGLAAPQIGQSLQLIIIQDMDHSSLTEIDLIERDRYKVPFHVVINPHLYIEEEEEAHFFEGCLSIPQLFAVVPRAKAVKVECLNERGEPITLKAHGWYARILQHEIDHLNGILCIDRCKTRSLTTPDHYLSYWKKKSIEQVYSTLSIKR